MAVAFVTGKWTGGGAANSAIAATKPTAGNMLAVFITKSTLPETAPKVEDNGGKGETGWTVNATHTLQNVSALSTWMATKKAEGTETEIKATGGTIQALAVAEVSGSSEVIDKIEATNNIASGTEGTTAAFTDTEAGDIIFVVVGGSTAALGIAEAFTGTGPALTLPETGTSRTYYGYSVPGEVVSGKTWTAKHATARPTGMLVVAFKVAEAAGAVAEPDMMV